MRMYMYIHTHRINIFMYILTHSNIVSSFITQEKCREMHTLALPVLQTGIYNYKSTNVYDEQTQ